MHRRRDARNNKNNRRGPRFGQRNRNFAATHDRPIIKALNDRERTPERLEGMIDGPSRFRDLDELSESMDESESSGSLDGDATGDGPRKRQKLENENSPVVTTKWSNPDPYTVLPPTGEQIRGRKTDVVQLIRKAKVAASEANLASKNDISGNMDFVPLDFGSEPDDESDSGEIAEDEPIQASVNEYFIKSRPLAARIERTNGTETTANLSEDQDSIGDDRILAGHAISDLLNINNVNASTNTKQSQTFSTNNNTLPAETFPTRSAPSKDLRKRKLDLGREGTVVQEWLNMSKDTQTPWVVIDHAETRHMGLW
jgi:non-canonical poly(A) RNA polymerase PAPD5/7